MIVSKASTFRTISLHGELHRHQTMSVRDRIANLNSSKTPIVTTVGSINATNSAQLPKTNRVDSTSSNTNSTETVDKESSDIEGNGMKKASTIAERIAKLKAGQGVGQIDAAAATTADTESSTKSSVSSRIALLGANINVASLSPGNPKQFNPFSPPSSRVNSNANSRENTSDNCVANTDLDAGYDNGSLIGTTRKTINSVPGIMVHLTLERPGRPSRSKGKSTVPAADTM